jgi:hypothetical protein
MAMASMVWQAYVAQLERTEPKISDRLIGLAQLWQAEVAARPKRPEERVYPTLPELIKTMRALGMDSEAIDKMFEARFGPPPDMSRRRV